MHETIQIRLPNEEKTQFAAMSLVSSLYDNSRTICLTGELGAGKTTFTKAFLKQLGVEEDVTSPTYAIEQRYEARNPKSEIRKNVLHMDLYRLNKEQAEEVLDASDDFDGIRVIEWADRVPDLLQNCDIHIHLEEAPNPTPTPNPLERTLTIHFYDTRLPSFEKIQEWQELVCLPKHIIAHCDAVGKASKNLGETLLERGQITRPETLDVSGKLHDLFRFVDFRDDQAHRYDAPPEESLNAWKKWKETYEGKRHEATCAAFLRDEGYPNLATIIETHGLQNSPPPRGTTEQKVLFYADKRVKHDELVTLEERFDDFHDRYGSGEETEEQREKRRKTLTIEDELFAEKNPTIRI